MRRVGHKGADLIVPGNTLASFDAAVEAGADMIEFDVLRHPRSGELVLAHDYGHDLDSAPTLDEGLAHLAATGLDLDVDLKLPGYELDVVAALHRHGVAPRSLISSQYRESLARIRAADPGLRLGWSVPKVKRDYTRSVISRYPAYVLIAYARRVLPGRAAKAIRSGFCDALMCNLWLVTPALVGAVREAGGEIYVWTVDDAARIRGFEAMGVTGVITNDPRLFS